VVVVAAEDTEEAEADEADAATIKHHAHAMNIPTSEPLRPGGGFDERILLIIIGTAEFL
jgi:hypothetical protein